jgi:sugar (pentulose or hexulose) kinase
VTEPLLLGLDVGTTAVKAAVIDGAGIELAYGRVPTPWRLVVGGAEIEPDALLRAALDASADALGGIPDGVVAAVGVASMAETGVLLDAHGRPLAPAIAWHDARGGDEAKRLAAELGAEAVAARTGLPASALCALAKYRWMRDHWPQTAFGTRWLTVAEWIVHGLGGDPAPELSLASRTGFYDLHARRPWRQALEWAGAPDGFAGAPVPAGTPMGHVDGGVLPRARTAALTVGGHDHLSAAVGAGAAGEGDVLDSAGTAEAFVRATAPLPPATVARAVAAGLTVGWHAIPERQAVVGATWSGAALERVLALLGVPVEQRDELESAALDCDPGGLELRGIGEDTLALAGIGRDASPAGAYRAALEVVGAAGADVLARIAEIAGPPRRLVVTGGWATGVCARAVKQRRLGPFEHSAAISIGAGGAALAAGAAAGLWAIDDAPALAPHVAGTRT